MEASPFGNLLRRYRAAANLTQEELAERANVSARAISDLERGVKRRPHEYSVQRLTRALNLSREERASLEAAAQALGPPATSGEDRDAPESPKAGEDRDPPDGVAATRRESGLNGNLPVPPTPFIGRERELWTVAGILRRSEVRLLTLTGPSGTGKTRLAMEVATRLVHVFPDRVCFVSLASIADPALVTSTIAGQLGLAETGGRALLDLLRGHLRDREMLLVLDNFEHLLPAAPLVADLVADCPRLKVLVTSRAVLRLTAEHDYAVPPLCVPDLTHDSDVASLARYDAVALFLMRARAARADFALTEEHAPVIAEICRRLDGLPLAIELAAARVRLFSPRALLARLSSRLGVLTGGARDVPARHQTLRGAIDWSHSLLDAREQRLFRRLAVFVGGCTLEAVEQVCNAEGELEVLEGVASLVDQSLLRPLEGSSEEPRLAMLETIREYAFEQLEESGEVEALQRCHAEYFLALAEEAEPALTGAEQTEWLARLEQEHDNLRAALRWCVQSGDSATGLRLGGALWRFWYVHSHFSEGRQWLSELLALPAAAADTLSRAKALNGAGNLAYSQGDYTPAEAWHEESLALRRRLDDRAGMAASLNNLALLARERGDYGAASRRLEESIALSRTLGRQSLEALALGNLGNVRLREGAGEAARELHTRALALFTAGSDEWGRGMALFDLATVAHAQGDLAGARAYYEESCARRRAVGDRRGLAASLAGLSAVFLELGEVVHARAILGECLALSEAIGDTVGLLEGLEGVAALAVTDQIEEAVRLTSAISALRVSLGISIPPGRAPRRSADIPEQGRRALGDAAFERAWAQGSRLSLAHALHMARLILDAESAGDRSA